MDTLLFITVENDTLIRILLLGFLGFLVSMLITPLYTTAAYKWQWWKKRPQATTSTDEKENRLVPTMAGAITVVAVCLVTLPFNLDRAETWLPIAAFAGSALAGLLGDIINIRGKGAGIASLRARIKLTLSTLVALIGGFYFYLKLDVSSIHIPVYGTEWEVGWLIVPLFVLVVVATAHAVTITDGLDGLAGGLAATAFATYAVIAALEGRFGVSGFCMTVVGALLSYTWFNIPPARFFMGDVGSFALGTALGVVAMLTDTLLLLPLIGLVFVAEAGSSLLQNLSKKLRGGKELFKLAPLHRHFEAIGWPDTKVTMRFWIMGQVSASLGLILFLLGRYF